MFGKKGKETTVEPKENYQITTIPAEFYGGQNPIIKFKNVERTVGPEPKKPEVPVVVKQTKNEPVKGKKPMMSRLLIISASVLLLAFTCFAGFYYWKTKQNGEIKPPVAKPPKIELSKPPEVQTPVVEPTTTPVIETPVQTSTPVIEDGKIEFPSTLLRKGADMDFDGLTDPEEELFGSDPGKPDTDSDNYDDYTEIYNLYSPTQMAPARLIADGSVKDYVNPGFNYKVYYPSTWAVGNVDQQYRDVLFSNITGDNIEIRVFDRSPGQNFEDWFAKEAPNENVGSLMDFVTVFKTAGRTRTDNLVYYFEDDAHFYVIAYHTTNSDVVNYKNVALMMARSFRFNNVDEALPEQKVIVTNPVQ